MRQPRPPPTPTPRLKPLTESEPAHSPKSRTSTSLTNGKPFYVGKGVRRRIFAHLDEERDSFKRKTIKELRAAGLEPRLELLTHGLKDDETALRIEAAVIDFLGLGSLTNPVSTVGSTPPRPRMSFENRQAEISLASPSIGPIHGSDEY